MTDFDEALHKVFSRVALTPYQILKAAEKWYGSKRAVAEELGVTTRSVERWMQQGRTRNGRLKAKEANLARIRDLANTPELRHAMRAPRRSQQAVSGGAHLKMSGDLGPISGKGTPSVRDYTREREIGVDISEEGMEEIRMAWETGEPEHVREVTREVIEREYGVANWDWHDDEKFDMGFDW